MFLYSTSSTRRIKPDHELWIPHAYQERAVDFLMGHGSAALFLDPGLGKTSVTLEAFDMLREEGLVKTMLVVAPLRVCQLVWRQEAKRWTQFRHLKFVLLHGPKKKDLLMAFDADIFLINPEGIAWLTKQFFGKKLPFDICTLDELTKWKNADAVRHKKFFPKIQRLKWKWGLTGSPIPNGYMDLFGQMKILDGGNCLGFYFSKFRDTYFEAGYDGFSYDLRRGADKRIEAAIKPYVLRMAAKDYLDLPPLIDVHHPVVMPPAGRKIYNTMKEEMIAEIGDTVIEAGNAAAVYSKLKQMANGAVYAGDGVYEPRKTIHIHDAKIEALQELVEELQGTPLLVGYEFNHDLKRLQKAFGGNIPYLGSGVSEGKAQKIERDWNNNKIPLLFAHPASAGHGLNFQRGNACHVGWFSITWDYELYDQFIKRVLRQGTKATTVFNHLFIVQDTLDIVVYDDKSAKAMTQDALCDALSNELYRQGRTATSPSEELEQETIDMRKLQRRVKAAEEPVEEQEEQEEEAPKRTRRTRRAAPEPEAEEGEYEEEEKPRRTRSRLRGETAAEPEAEEAPEEEAPQKRSRTNFRKSVRDRLADAEGEEEVGVEEGQEEAPPKRSRSRKSADKAVEPEPEAERAGGVLSIEELKDEVRIQLEALLDSELGLSDLAMAANIIATLSVIK